jgi:hypothetical protein
MERGGKKPFSSFTHAVKPEGECFVLFSKSLIDFNFFVGTATGTMPTTSGVVGTTLGGSNKFTSTAYEKGEPCKAISSLVRL